MLLLHRPVFARYPAPADIKSAFDPNHSINRSSVVLWVLSGADSQINHVNNAGLTPNIGSVVSSSSAANLGLNSDIGPAILLNGAQTNLWSDPFFASGTWMNSTSFSVMIRARFHQVSARQDIVGIWDTAAGNRQFVVTTDAAAANPRIIINKDLSGTIASSGNSSIAIVAEKWHTLLGVYDRDAQTLKIYVDGLLGSTGVSTGLALTVGSGAKFAANTGYSYGVAPNFDAHQVRLWNRALDPKEVFDLGRDPYLGFVRMRSWLNVPSTVAAGPQTITPSKIPTHATWGTPVVRYPNSLIPAALGPHRAWQNAKVAGPLIPSKIPTHASWPAFQVKLSQTVTVPAAFSRGRTVYGPAVAIIQSIRPAAPIPTRAAWPTPVMKGGPSYLSVFGIPARRSFTAPNLAGGLKDLRIYIGGVDATQYLSYAPGAVTIQSQTIGRWKATFALEVGAGIGGYQPQLGQTVLMVDAGARVFAGCITDKITDRHAWTTNQITYHCTAVDKSGICDHRRVTGKTYTAGTDVRSVILDLVANFLNGEGITTQGVPIDGSLGTLGADLKLNFPTVTSALDQIAQQTGTVWWIDVFGVLTFASMAQLPAAPFTLTETSLNWRNASGHYGLTMRETTTDYWNKLYAVSNLNILPGSGSGGSGSGGAGSGNTETFTWTADGPGIQTITNSSGVRVATAIVCSSPIGSITSLKVNGVAQTAVDFGAYAGQTPSGADLLWLWAGPATGSPAQFVSPTVLPSAGATIVVNYVPAVATSSSIAQYGTALAPANPQGAPLGTCGSGIYEGVIQVQNISRQSDLNAIALAELNRIGGIPKVIDFETDFPGLQPGQQLSINIPLSGINNLHTLVTSVNGVFIPPTLANGGSIRWQVQARSNLDPGNWVKWYERLIERTQNALPVLQYEEAVFILGSGTTLSGGTNLANPYIVGRTGLAVELLVAAGTPPTGQDLILTINRNGAFLATVTLPAGTAANALVTKAIPAASALYLYARDVLNVTASYSVTSGSPVKAAAVTLKVRWAM